MHNRCHMHNWPVPVPHRVAVMTPPTIVVRPTMQVTTTVDTYRERTPPVAQAKTKTPTRTMRNPGTYHHRHKQHPQHDSISSLSHVNLLFQAHLGNLPICPLLYTHFKRLIKQKIALLQKKFSNHSCPLSTIMA